MSDLPSGDVFHVQVEVTQLWRQGAPQVTKDVENLGDQQVSDEGPEVSF
jgi:hypothetical protein